MNWRLPPRYRRAAVRKKRKTSSRLQRMLLEMLPRNGCSCWENWLARLMMRRILKTLDQLRQTAPTSGWLEQGLLSSANRSLLKKDYDRAIDAFRELQQRFPNGNRASYAHSKLRRFVQRQGRADEAKKGFEDQISQYPRQQKCLRHLVLACKNR